MNDRRETAHGVLVDTDAIRAWSAEAGVVPVYYPEEDRYELVSEDEVTGAHERHGWEEFSERFADRDEALVYDDADGTGGDASTARFVDRTEALEASGRARGPDEDETATTDPDGPGSAAEADGTGVPTVDASDQGKRVFDRDGNEIGIVEAVDEDEERLYVDPDPGVLDEVRTELGWASRDEDDYVLAPDQIASREGHQIVVHGG